MAVPSSPKLQVYHSPNPDRNRMRRGSSRKSFTSPSIPVTPMIESPRTLCPKDTDAFSYDPTQLSAWYVAQELWDRLPSTLQASLTAMQRAGAAVDTGFDRLHKHRQGLEGGRPTHKLEEDEFLVQLEDLPSPKIRTVSNASSVLISDLSSPVFTNNSNSGYTSPSLSASQGISPVSPMCLTPLDSETSQKTERSRQRSFSTPLEPNDAYYANELSHLRTEALPRLRHAVLKVDTEWTETKRNDVLDINDVNSFESWWIEKKCTVLKLNDDGQRLSNAIGLAPTGMGWTAP